MKQNVMLTIASLLSILLRRFTLRTTSSVGYRRPSPQTLRWPFSWCCCTGRWCSPNGDRGTEAPDEEKRKTRFVWTGIITGTTFTQNRGHYRTEC
jgi:hypothetical protein